MYMLPAMIPGPVQIHGQNTHTHYYTLWVVSPAISSVLITTHHHHRVVIANLEVFLIRTQHDSILHDVMPGTSSMWSKLSYCPTFETLSRVLWIFQCLFFLLAWLIDWLQHLHNMKRRSVLSNIHSFSPHIPIIY